MKFRALAVSCCSIALLALLSGCATQEELNAEKERSAELEERVKAMEDRLVALESGPKKEAQIAQEESAARQVYSAAQRNVSAGKIEEAKKDLAKLLKDYPQSKSARSAKQLQREVAIIGTDAGSLDVEKWYTGEAKMDDGKVTILVFWEAWCPHCKREVPKLEATYQKFKGDGLNLIGLTKVSKSSTDAKVEAFITDNKLTYPMAKENDGRLSSRFAVSGVPAAAVVKDGKVVWRGHPNRLKDATIQEWLAK
jgi:thiol-disulfide isomerase/thioredoxin